MSTAVQPRRPAGSSTGGQYAESVRAEVDLELPTHDGPLAAFPDDADPGQAPQVSVGARTPWGAADAASAAPGAVFVSTPSHGGIRLSAERNAHIPPALRQRSGWYDEDDGAQVVAVFHPDLWPGREDEARQTGLTYLRDFRPEEYEALTGVTLGPEESWTRARQAQTDSWEELRERWRKDLVTTGSCDPGFLPAGFGAVKVECRDTGEARVLLCDSNFWSARGISDTRTPVRVDDRMTDITDIIDDYQTECEPADPPPVSDLGVDVTALTTAQRTRATKELATRYRYADGVVRTLAQGLVHQGACGKEVLNVSGKAMYVVRLPDNRIHTVHKATFDAMTSLPDLTREDLPSRLELSAAGRALDANPRDPAARARYDLAHEKCRQLDAAEADQFRQRRLHFQRRVLDRLAGAK